MPRTGSRDVRLIRATATLLGSGESLAAFGLLTTMVVLFPPSDPGPRLLLVMAAAIALTGVGLHAVRAASRPGTRLARMGCWARATAALGAGASVLMIVAATVSALG
jgi:hypothetical protein